MIVADASWVIALSDPDDPHHAAAVVLNRMTIDAVVVLHPVTLAECLIGPASRGLLDHAAGAFRSSFEIASVDADAPLRWAAGRGHDAGQVSGCPVRPRRPEPRARSGSASGWWWSSS